MTRCLNELPPNLLAEVTACREHVARLHAELPRWGLVVWTAGNVSQRISVPDGDDLFVIKPSGVSYDKLSPQNMVVCDLSGNKLEDAESEGLSPSSDTAAHAYVYRHMPHVGGVVHTHSTYATIMAQARRPIPCLGTTHADYFYGTIPVTRDLTPAEIEQDYVLMTGQVIVETFQGIDPLTIPAVLVAGHGPFVWGRTPADAVHNALILEEVARMAWHVIALNPDPAPISQALLDRHYLRKHGAKATYGQGK